MSGLRVERFIDPKSGEPKVSYLYNREIVRKVELSGNFAAKLAGLSLIEKDLKNAKKWMRKIQELSKDMISDEGDDSQYFYARNREVFDEIKAFFVAAVTFYGKAFTEANGRGAQLQRDWLSEEFRSSHDFYMNYRHNFTAHSGDEKLEYGNTYLLLIPHNKSIELQLGTNRIQPDIAFTEKGGDDFINLIDHVIDIVNKRNDKQANQILEAARKRGLVFWALASGSTASINMDESIKTILKRRK